VTRERALRTVFLGLATLGLAACGTENSLVDQPSTAMQVVEMSPDSFEPAPEEPRFYLLDPTYAPAVSDDGTVLLYEWSTGGDVYLWTEDQGLEWVTTTGTWFNTVQDISADGSTIIGDYGNYEAGEDTQAATWTRADGWTQLGALPDTLNCPMQSSGWALNADGTVASGLAFVGCSAYGFRWDATNGMVAYDQLGNGGNRITKMSRDGELAVGFAQGDSSRTPAVWYADGSGEVMNMSWTGELYGVAADGSLAVGQLGSKAGTWSPTDGPHILGTLGSPGQTSARAVAVCGATDELILGADSLSGGIATAWTEGNGIVALQDYLESFGMEFPSATRLQSATACNPDETVLVGKGSVGDRVGSWVVVLPPHYLD